MVVLSQPFSFMILQVWASSINVKKVSVFGFVQVAPIYFSWIFLAISWLLGNIVSHNIIGIALGFLLYKFFVKK